MIIGDRVRWTSSGVMKEGVITHVIPIGRVPAHVGVPRLDNSGLPRDHESYVVKGQHVFRGAPEGRRANYWPLVSLLNRVEDGGTKQERLERALRTIATFPITHRSENMDAANMRKIAEDAIGAD